MNLSKDYHETIKINKRKTFKFSREGEFFHLKVSHFELDNKGRESKLLQTVEITLTMDETANLLKYITDENFKEDLPF